MIQIWTAILMQGTKENFPSLCEIKRVDSKSRFNVKPKTPVKRAEHFTEQH